MKISYTLTKVALVWAFSFIALSVNAQYNGKITSSEDGQALVGASVVVKGTSIGTITDTDGAFSIAAKSGNVLVISFIGYEPQDIKLGTTTKLDVVMKAESTNLQEVVTTALNIKKNRTSIGYAVQEIKGIDLIKAREPNPINGLIGKIAGLRVGASAELLGQSNVLLRGARPLYVVDGVPINSDTWNISPDDVETITVLKGPNAAALYGQRGRDGAIQITTKRGSKDKRGFAIDFTSSTMTENSFLTIPKVQDKFGPGDHGKYAFVDGKGGGLNDGDYDIWGPEFDKGTLIPQYDSPIDPATGKRTATPWVSRGKDNLTRFLQPGILSNNNLSISGSSDKFDFRISGSQGYQQGSVPNTYLNTTNFNFSGGYKFTDKLKFDATMNYSRQYTENAPDVNYGPNSLIYNVIIWGGADWNVADFKPYESGGKTVKPYWQAGKEGVQQIYAEYQRYNNPYFQSYEWLRGHYKNDIYGTASLKYDFTPDLSLMVRTQITTYDLLRTEKVPYSGASYGREERKGDYREDSRKLFENNTDALLSYNKRLTPDIKLGVSVGGNTRNLRYNNNYTTTDYLAVPGVYNFNNSLNPVKTANFFAPMAVNSAYGVVDLSYKTWAFLNATGRTDKSSALLPANNTFFYPSVSASLVPSEMVDLGPISYLKLRGSYAQVGGSLTEDTKGTIIGSFLNYGADYRTPYGGPSFLTPTYNIVRPYNNLTAATAPTTILDPNLKPATNTSYEGGAEIKFFKNRLGFDVTYFSLTDGPGIFDLTLSETSGAKTYRTNGITWQRKGLELSMMAQPIKMANGFTWNVLANWSTYKETLKDIYPTDPSVTSINRFLKIGDRSDYYQGSALARNTAGQIIYGADGLPLRSTQNQILGYSNPDWEWSAINTFSFKGLSVGFQFDGRQGGVIGDYVEQKTYQGGRHYLTGESPMLEARQNDAINVKSYVGDGVKITNGVAPKFDAEGKITNLSEIQFAPNDTKQFLQDWIARYYGTTESFIISRSFAKLREVTVAYELPTAWVKKAKMQKVVISLVGRNLFYWAARKDVDVEQFVGGGAGNYGGGGRADLQTPTMRRYGLNVNITF
jgi:TonB-linked SusC/RagA family outer membrane protein